MYRIGFPFWRQAALLGARTKLRIDVIRDPDANVFVATSDDLKGLVCEAALMDDLVKEVELAMTELLELQLRARPRTHPVTEWRIGAA